MSAKLLKEPPSIRDLMDEHVYPVFDFECGYRLKVVRWKERLDQFEMAFKLGITQQFLSQIEQGRTVKPQFSLASMIKALGWPAAAYILSGKNSSRWDPVGYHEKYLEWERQQKEKKRVV